MGGSACNAADAATTNGVNHPWVGDLIFTLTSPAGTTVTVISQAGGGNNNGNHFCNTVLDDDTANGSIQSVAAGTHLNTGTFKPANPLSAFDGQNPNGTWTLNVRDVGTPDQGNVTAFSLDIAQAACPAVPSASIGGQITLAPGGGGVSGATVQLTGTETQTTTTDGSGNYSFALTTCGGTYTVTPSKAGHTFNPSRRTFVNVAGSQSAPFTATAAVTPAGVVPGRIVISEFRARGLAGALDEFVEVYNKSDAPVTVGAADGSSAGWLVAALSSDGLSSVPVYTIPNGTVIPARGHFLIANGGGYTLDAHAAADAYSTADIPDNTGVAVFDTGTTSGAVLDAAGFNTTLPVLGDTYREGGGMPPVGTTNGQYGLLRKLTSGTPLDTGNNTNDFILVATDQAAYGGRQSLLGAPGPESLSSPVVSNGTITPGHLDPAQPTTAAPNRVRSLAPYTDTLTPVTAGGAFTNGTLSIRRKFTNNTGAPVSRLRFRIVDATVGAAPAGTADLRVLTSANSAVAITGGGPAQQVRGLTLEQPATQPQGGGLNSTVAAGIITAGTPLAPGASINVEFLLGVRQAGGFRFFVNVEALP
ncbi:MAG: proprotein convertase P-domain-containing protein [Acidobacteria bacterium]|nr:proprotein convertase P-domain-containing protein [Acidobacteriota bacterium]